MISGAFFNSSSVQQGLNDAVLQLSHSVREIWGQLEGFTPSKSAHRREQDTEWLDHDGDRQIAGKSALLGGVGTLTGSVLPMPKHLDGAASGQPDLNTTKIMFVPHAKAQVSQTFTQLMNTPIGNMVQDVIVSSGSTGSGALMGGAALMLAATHMAVHNPDRFMDIYDDLSAYGQRVSETARSIGEEFKHAAGKVSQSLFAPFQHAGRYFQDFQKASHNMAQAPS